MITAVDTNILLDIFLPDKRFGQSSASLLKMAYDEGALVICDVVYGELVPQFADRTMLDQTLATINISCSSLDPDIAFLAGKRWAEYRQAGGKRNRIITDFLIGAHALKKSDRFLSRDRGFYESYFPELQIFSL